MSRAEQEQTTVYIRNAGEVCSFKMMQVQMCVCSSILLHVSDQKDGVTGSDTLKGPQS